MSVYYNDSEPFVCAWLKNLIAAGLIPAGDVDERPIQEVMPDDVRGYTQAHFFAGIGGWPYALQLAGWGDRPVWTGSCPCQPFSAAGKGKAEDDARHLWPHWFRLIRECRPERVFGEQVANGVGKGWWDVVSTDLEAEAYTVGAVVLGAHSVGAPHIRQRLWFVADAEHAERWPIGVHREDERHGGDAGRSEAHGESGARSEVRLVDDTASARCDGTGQGPESEARDEARVRGPECRRTVSELGDTTEPGCERGESESSPGRQAERRLLARPGDARDLANTERRAPERRRHDVGSAPGGVEGQAWERERLRLDPWAGCEFVPCRDGKARPVEPGTFPLAHGIPNRVGRLRGYGNAIVPETAAAFVSAYMELCPTRDPGGAMK